MKQDENVVQKKDKKQEKIPKFPKFYVLCDRVYYGLEIDPYDPRSSKSEVFYTDNITHIFENEDEYVDYIKTNVVTDYANLPMKDLCCKYFIGLDAETIYFICKAANGNIKFIEANVNTWRDKFKPETYKKYFYSITNDNKKTELTNVVKYVNLFDEISNEVIGNFVLSHISNNKFFDLELEWNNDHGVYDITNYSEIVKDRSLPKKKKEETQDAKNQEDIESYEQ